MAVSSHPEREHRRKRRGGDDRQRRQEYKVRAQQLVRDVQQTLHARLFEALADRQQREQQHYADEADQHASYEHVLPDHDHAHADAQC